ncbi:MAG: CPBP family glutamic-type intramembrane protease, partial [Terracidiphilus sp.]
RTRVASGRVTWTGPLVLTIGRGFFWMAAQALVALIFLLRHHPSPWHEACYWWSVCFTLGDLTCLALLRHFTRREGIRMRDLVGPVRLRHGRDIFLGLGYYLLAFPFFIVGGYLAQAWFYGHHGISPSAFILNAHALPLWAVIYSFSIYWIIQSATEEATYQAYALPRLEALTGHTWIAFAIVAFWFTAQHCVLGFVPDWRSNIYRFVGFLPGVIVVMAIYVRTRRLAPLILAHWLIDIGAVAMTTF